MKLLVTLLRFSKCISGPGKLFYNVLSILHPSSIIINLSKANLHSSSKYQQLSAIISIYWLRNKINMSEEETSINCTVIFSNSSQEQRTTNESFRNDVIVIYLTQFHK